MGRTFDTVLFDIGGTLWPDVFEEAEQVCVARLKTVLPTGDADQAPKLLRRIEETASRMTAEADDGATANSRTMVENVLASLALSISAEIVDAVRRAMVIPADEGRLFPGAVELLETVRELGLRCGAISNTVWRDADDYRRDFERLGVSPYFDLIVTSVDAGVRKPDPRIFRLALDGLGTNPMGTIVVGNSELADITPARQLHTFTIRVAIEEPVPALTQADVVVGSLFAVRNVIDFAARASWPT